jgi:hypothetical protein
MMPDPAEMATDFADLFEAAFVVTNGEMPPVDQEAMEEAARQILDGEAPGGADGDLQLLADMGLESKPVEQEHKYASTQFNLPADLAETVQAFGQEISDEDLAEDGREERPHVTVLFGIHAP